jgi:uncharacterized protein
MTEGQDPAPAGSEPSMEEILASIRKIISDEEPAAAATGAAPVAGADDVIELTQMVQDDGSVVDIKPAPPEEKPMAEAKPAQPAPAPEPAKAEAPKAPPPPPPSAPAPEKSTLVSEPAASKSASALSSLASTVEIERLASTPHSVTALGNGSRTLEDMVLEMLRPLLKDWLDKNLPGTVDRLVQKEIERIARKAQD